MKAAAAQGSVREYQDKTAERETKRREEGQTDAPPTTTPASSSRSSGDAARTGSYVEGAGSSRVEHKRKADGEHREDAEREDGMWMSMEGNKRKTVEEEEESMLGKTV